jgi:type I restriction enzyme S subunit
LLLLQDFRAQAKSGSQPFVSYEILKKPRVLIPPLEEQKRIVAILDRFDALCNDLTTGLPAEIEARQKQYEYYRDKLLSFKEVTVICPPKIVPV